MMGTDQEPGIIPLTVKEIFDQIELTEDREFLLRVGYIEIYNERIFDLLDEGKVEILKLSENPQGEVSVNQTEVVTSSQETILDHYKKGSRGRVVGETGMNERSSRSHTIFRIIIESKSIKEEASHEDVVQVSTLNLVDLAGSERADQTRATGERLREGGHINKSLLSLSNVIRDLSNMLDNAEKAPYINYRDSKLTRILSASLGGNAMTAIICTIAPSALEETYSTLTFASNAKKIKNKPKVNEIVSDKVIMNRLQKEIASLRDQLKLEKSRSSEVTLYFCIILRVNDTLSCL
jgi:centromeric protein E